MLWILIAVVLAVVASAVGLMFEANVYYKSSMAGDFFWAALVIFGIAAFCLNVKYHNETMVEFEEYSIIQNMGDSNGTQGSFSLFGAALIMLRSTCTI